MISVVLPTYNGQQYIEKSIMSILEQSYTDFELIVIDDCSQDNTWDLLQKMAKTDSRIRIYQNKVNQKLPKSLNIGFSYAQGDYYTWTSDDNIYKKNAFEKMMRIFKEDSEADIVYALFDLINEKGEIFGTVDAETCDSKRIYEKNPIGACFLYKKEVHEKLNGYDVNKFLVEDYDFWLRANRYFNYRLIEEVLYEYRCHNGSLTAGYSDKIELETVKRIVQEIEEHSCNKKEIIMACKRVIPPLYRFNEKILVKKCFKMLKKVSVYEYLKLYFKIKVHRK